MSEPELLAGAARRDITPPLGERPVFLAGFGNDRRATGVESPLFARALALRHGDAVAVLVACDLIGLGRPDVDELRAALAARGYPPEALIVACTHTHSGPDTLGLWGIDRTVSGVDLAYLAAVKAAVVEAADEALARSCPVRLRCATTRLPGLIANFRDPDVVDDEVAALQLVRPDGELVATLLNLACHPEVLWSESTLISADYAGHACRAVEELVGGMALHVSGALGGMLSPNTDDHSPAFAAHMGRAYARAALDALGQAPLVDAPRLVLRRTSVELELLNPLLQLAQQAGVLRPRPLHDGRLLTTCAYLDLGPAQLLALPGELLPRLGFELKAAMPGPCRILAGLADDELGYILPDDEFVTPADYSNPGRQYEESVSVGPQAGSTIVRAALSLIGAAP